MLTFPVLKECYHAEFMDGEKILLTSEHDNALLSGRIYYRILFEIQRDAIPMDRLVEKLSDSYSMFEVYYAVDVLERKGYLRGGEVETIPRETRAFWAGQGIDAGSMPEILKHRPVAVEHAGEIDPGPFVAALKENGVMVATSGAALTVIVTHDYQHRRFKDINRNALENGGPWMMVKPAAIEPWIGPVFLPGKSACWECLNQRITMNRPIQTFYQNQTRTDRLLPVPPAFTPQSLQVAINLAVQEIVKWLFFGFNRRLEGTILSWDNQTAATRVHTVVKRPQCSACGTPLSPSRKPRPLELSRTRGLIAGSAGGYRSVTPEETLEKYDYHISPVSGIVHALKPYFHQKNTPVHNFSSGPNTALKSKTLYWLNSHIRTVSGGKGRTAAQARAGALCEAIERYSMIYRGDEIVKTARLEDLNGYGIHPNRCMNYSPEQYREREGANRECARFYDMVPVPFDPGETVDWTPVYSLTRRDFKYLPSLYCYSQYPAPDEKRLFAYPDSNGCASGNTLEEAVLQGFLELIERDAVALWWYNMLPKPGVDLHSFNDPYFERLLHYYRSLDRGIHVLDLTSDFDVPVFGAVSFRLNSKEENKVNKENIIFGFGAHVDARLAIDRALIELNQILPVAIMPGTDPVEGKYLTTDPAFVQWLEQATLENQPYLVPRDDVPLKQPADYPPLCEADIYESLTYCTRTAETLGLETLVLDLTREDVGLNAVRVIVPGMRHFWKRLGSGRLYDVPVRMGWRDKPLSEEQMNPIGLFI